MSDARRVSGRAADKTVTKAPPRSGKRLPRQPTRTPVQAGTARGPVVQVSARVGDIAPAEQSDAPEPAPHMGPTEPSVPPPMPPADLQSPLQPSQQQQQSLGQQQTKPEQVRRSASALRRAESQRTSLSVHFKEDPCTVVEVPVDQLNPLDVWNVYSPVRYVTRKEQRSLDSQRRSRTAEVLEYCANLFESTKVDQYVQEKQNGNGASVNAGGSKNSLARLSPDKELRNDNCAVAASFIMSMWPGFPVEARPSMSLEAEAAFPHLYKGTHLCIFNEENDSPLRCTAALRLLRNMDGDEGSIAIYNNPDLSSIDGYIPLCFLHSVSRGLESIERHRYVRDGIVKCKTDEGKTIQVSYTRAFTLHCRAPQRFYVSFIAMNEKDLDRWMRVLSYFVFLNSQCRTYYNEHPEI